MNYWLFFVLSLMMPVITVFAATPELAMQNLSPYELKIQNQTYPILYQVNATVLTMAIDTESKSLLVGLENTQDSKFIIKVKHELINAHNEEFIILVNGLETEYSVTSDSDNSTIAFFVPSGTEEVEIVGTNVIPEFPIGTIASLTVMILVVTIIAKAKTHFFKL
jgi:hypothetical protein